MSTREERDTWTAQEKYRFRTVEAKKLRGRPILSAPVVERISDIERFELSEAIDQALMCIPVRDEMLIRCAFGVGTELLTHVEIAEKFGICYGYTGVRIAMAMRKLQAKRLHLRFLKDANGPTGYPKFLCARKKRKQA